ncbi:DUF3168 domain-containing protein [Achromobacter pestifer]
MFPDVYRMLLTPQILALLGNPPRIYDSGAAPQGVATPYLTWFVVVGDPHDHLSGPPESDADTVQLDCYAGPDGPAKKQVSALARAVRDALDEAFITNRLVIDNREPDTGLYRIALQADFIQNR